MVGWAEGGYRYDCAHRQGAVGARYRHVPLGHCGSECAVHTHLMTARYVLVAALNRIEVDVAAFSAHHGCLGDENLITSATERVDVFQLS